MSTLKEQVAQRKREAEEKRLGSKAAAIAQYLGMQTSDDTHVFSVGGFKITYTYGVIPDRDGDMPYSRTQIAYKDKMVFLVQGGEVESYVPGSWEPHFGYLYRRAAHQRKENDRAEQAARNAAQAPEEQRTRELFGL